VRVATAWGWPVMENNRTYFMRRAAQERSAASRSAHATARQAHEKMAERYQELAQSSDTGERSTAA
jgi:hypothetical protein